MISRHAINNPKEGEKVVFHLRRHWFSFLKLFIFYFILAVVPLVAYFFFNLDLSGLLSGDITRPLSLIGFFTYYLCLMVFSLSLWTDNYLDVWTVTTDRIISRNQNGLFNRTVAELDLSRIQDVTVEQKGFFSTILNFGYVYIQTAAEQERFVFEQVSHPYQIAKTIQQLDEACKNRK